MRWILFWLVLMVGLAYASRVVAQVSGNATLYPPETQAFPSITAFLDVHDASGGFFHGLKEDDLVVVENDRRLPVFELRALQPGVQFVLAITYGPSMSIRDGLGISRYEYLVMGITSSDWGERRSGLDDLTLLMDNGPEAIHVDNPSEWIASLSSHQPSTRDAVASLAVLSRALDIASDPTPRPGMERAVLFITPLQGPDVAVGLQSLAARAVGQEIRISVWLVASPDLFSSPGADQLRALAAETGGQFWAFSGFEPVPDLEDYLEPLRHIYSLSYTSQITTSGVHTLTLHIDSEDFQVSTPPRSFELDIRPPNPMFVSVPSQILRTFTLEQEAEDGEASMSRLHPVENILEVLVEFPDGHPRPLLSTALYVDGVVVHENTAPPFDEFIWDLTGYDQSGSHQIRVEATDNLGLTGTSIEIPVQVVVQPIARILSINFSGRGVLLAGLMVLLAGSVLALVLIFGGRIRPQALGRSKRAGGRMKGRAPARSAGDRPPAHTDPLTQPVIIDSEPSPRRLPAWINRLHWPHRRQAPAALALLTPLSDSDQPPAFAPIPVAVADLRVGRDPSQVSLVLTDPSVENLHARLVQEGGAFRLIDEGSVAGTWINYAPVSRQGTLLEHGDLVHIGRVGFRFTLRRPGQVRKPVITLQEPER